MNPSLALATLVAVAFVHLASTEEGMGLCYRCPLQNLENNEGSAFAWVKSFLQEIKSRCPGLKTRRRVIKPPSTSTYTTSNPRTTTTTKPATITDPPTTTTEPQTTTTDPPTTTTEPQTTTTEPQTTTPIAPTPPLNAAADCQALFNAGNTASGVYTIYPTQYPGGLQVRCDMTTDSKAWIVFQRRVDGTVNFTRSWVEYKDGFGDKEGEFWLGNEILRRLTETADGGQGWEMRVDLVDKANPGDNIYALYEDFRLTGGWYTLSLVFNGTQAYMKDSLSPSHAGNGHPFTTYDSDNDEDTAMNCADTLKGGWWFDNCGTKDNSGTGLVYSNLNGEYGKRMITLAFVRGIVWSSYSAHFTKSEMKMRRNT